MNAKSNTIQRRIVYGYTRWSSEPQIWGDSERRQERAAQEWCQRNNRILADTRFADKGVSGWRGDNRTSGRLGDLLKVVRPGDTILIEDADRWSRENPLDSLNALRDTVNKGVDIVFLKTGVRVSSSNFNDPSVLIPNFFASFLANAENEKQSYRIREAMTKRRAQIESGKAVRGQIPCWLKWDQEQGKPVVIEEKAKAVRRLFELSLSGMGVQSIVREMAGIPCISNSKKARWNPRLVYRILTETFAIGHYHRTDAPSIPGVFPAIISEADYYSSCAKMKARRNFTVPHKYKNNSLFTRLAKCSACGGSLIKTRCGHNMKYYDYDYLVCANSVRQAKDSCEVHATGIRYDAVQRTFLDLLSDSALIRRALAGQEQEGPDALSILKGKLASVQAKEDKLLTLIEGDDCPAKRLADRLKQLEAEEADQIEQIEAEDAKANALTPTEAAYAEIRSLADCKQPEWRSRFRAVLPSLADKIVVELGQDKRTAHFIGGGKIEVALAAGQIGELTLIGLGTGNPQEMGGGGQTGTDRRAGFAGRTGRPGLLAARGGPAHQRRAGPGPEAQARAGGPGEFEARS